MIFQTTYEDRLTKPKEPRRFTMCIGDFHSEVAAHAFAQSCARKFGCVALKTTLGNVKSTGKVTA